MEVLIQGNYEGSKLSADSKGIAIVVDVLRASTTIPVAMSKGIEVFFVAKEVEDARLAQTELNTILVGERGCIKLPGFDFGNSPVEMSKQTKFENNIATFTSSTGSRRVVEAIGSKITIIGSIINAKAVAEKVIELSKQFSEELKVVIIPTFSHGSIIEYENTEDQIGSLLIAREFLKMGVELSVELKEEIAFLEQKMNKQSLTKILEETEHGKKLINLKFTHDISYCSRLNELTQIPISRNEVYTLSSGNKVVKMILEK
ncbi:MAG: 2-phosphosulfolactate phosphatase [Candidatus Heimdallarchaeota archaeon]|nr:2-phosphosulfolactate phosphatase [Candidatus Heimdallarchaeota archaeon]MBY8994597.1 2-phosphosulfolactate phosphatase [Candidatus Heimdallarchaeota archaeon]